MHPRLDFITFHHGNIYCFRNIASSEQLYNYAYFLLLRNSVLCFLFYQIYCKFVKNGGCSNATYLVGGLTKHVEAVNGGFSGYCNEHSISILGIVPFHKELPRLLLEPLHPLCLVKMASLTL